MDVAEAAERWNDPSPLDRLSNERAAPAWVAEHWPSSRLLLTDGNGQVAVAEDALDVRTATGPHDPQRDLLLGRLAGELWFTRLVATVELGESRPLRQLLPGLDDGLREVALAAMAVTGWHRLDPRCPGCGQETMVRQAGFERVCPQGRVLFPRSDPAIIVAIVDDDNRILLGHQANWPQGRVSTFAGFVEAGESLEQAVHREMAEETGLRMRSVHYVGSQAWPFPRSLMIGYLARAEGTRTRVDGVEITSAQWYTPGELEAAVVAGWAAIPGAGSISRRLIDAWLAGLFGGGDSGIRLDSSW